MFLCWQGTDPSNKYVHDAINQDMDQISSCFDSSNIAVRGRVEEN